MDDGNYMVALGQPSGSVNSTDGRQMALAVVQVTNTYNTTNIRVCSYNTVSGGGVSDPPQVNVAIFR